MKSKPMLQIFLPVSGGIILARFFPISLPTVFLLTLFWVVLTLISLKFIRHFNAEILFSICLFAFGFFRQVHFDQGFAPNHVKNLPQLFHLPVEVIGKLQSEPISKPNYQIFLIEAERIKTGTYQFPVAGVIRGYLPKGTPKFKPGDVLQLGGVLKPPRESRNPGGFDFSKYLATQSIFAILTVKDSTQIQQIRHENAAWLEKRVIKPARTVIASRLEKLMPCATANLFKGLILGQKQDIAAEFLQALAFTGTSHILAVSGLHAGFILLILWLVLRTLRIPPGFTVVLTILGLSYFALLTGARPPVIRAVIMASVFLVGSQTQRLRDGMNNLAFAALIILLADPSELFNPGFQLSFSAVFSILYLYPPITRSFRKILIVNRLTQIPAVEYLMNLLSVSLAVSVGTAPIVAYYFHLFPPIGIFANILVVPLTGLLVALGIGVLFFSIFSSPISQIYSETVQLFTNGLFIFVQRLGDLPGSHFFVPRPTLFGFIFYYTLLLIASQWRRIQIRKYSLIFLLILLNGHVWHAAIFKEKTLQIIHFDVGQGDAALVRFPNSKTLLIDAGDRDENHDCGAQIISPYLRMHGVSRLDYVLATHPHDDHIGGLPYILRNFKVAQLFVNGDSCESPIFDEFLAVTDSLKIPVQRVKAGDCLHFAEKVEGWVFHPPDSSGIVKNHENNNSIVLKLIYGNSTFLFTGDIENLAENQLFPFGRLLQSNILKVAHHGSAYSTIPPFLDQVQPRRGIISVGEYNRFNQPAPVILERLAAAQIEILRTDLAGAIVFESDGIETWRVIWR
jgi:competence protein ComEC